MELLVFGELLERLKSTDNAVRKDAEGIYGQLEPKVRAVNLLQIISGARPSEPKELEIALFASVLLRRLITSDFKAFYNQFSPEDQKTFRNQLVHLLTADISREPTVKRKICDAISEVTRSIYSQEEGDATWKELVEFTFNALSGQEKHLKQCALMILGDYPGLFGEEGRKRLTQIKATIMRATMEETYEIQQLAVITLIQFIIENANDEDDKRVIKVFQDCMQHIYRVTTESVKQGDPEILKNLIELVEEFPKLLRPDVPAVFDFATATVTNADIQDDIRQLAMELLVTLCESAPQIVRKHAVAKIPQFVHAMLLLMTELEDDPEWLTADENKTEEEDSNSYVAESSIDRVACALGGKAMLRPLLNACHELLLKNEKPEDWKFRHAALMAISATGEGLTKSMEKHLDEIVNVLQKSIVDPSPRVRYAACNCFGQLSTDFAPTFQKKFKQVVIDSLLHAVTRDTEPRVQSHAIAAMINFTEECDLKILSKFLDPILNVLYTTMESKFKEFQVSGRKLVLENVITEIASLADKIEDKFAPYYERFMPYLKFIAQNIHQKEFRLLRGKAIECISLIGMCVPREKFFQDANEVMQMLLKTQTGEEEVAADDVSYSYYINAWGRICRILGREFAVYLPMVMGPVMKAAEQKAEISVVDEDDVEAHQEDGDWTFMNITGDKQNVGIKTAGLDEKADALDILRVYAQELKEEFAGYVEPVVKLMVDSLNFFVHEGCRQNAAAAIPRMLDVAKVARNPDPRYMFNMWRFVYPKLIQSINDEPDPETLGDKLGCLADSVAVVGPEALTEQEMDDVFKALETNLEDYFTRAEERLKARTDEDYDEEMQENLDGDAKSDYYLISRISDVVHHLFKVYGAALCPRFEKFLNVLMKLAAPSRPFQELQWAICTFDSLLQFAGEKAALYKDLFIPIFKTGLRHPEGPVRQAAAFGWGLMAQYTGDALVSHCIEIVPVLLETINHPDARNEDNEGPTENCISAIVRFLKYRPIILESHGSLDHVRMHLLQWLPVYIDPDETPVIYDYFAELIEQNNPVLLGQNFTNLPRIVQIIAEALEKDALEDDEEGGPANAVYNRLLDIVRHVQHDANVFQSIVSGLTHEQQEALSKALHQPLRKVGPV
ncbi:importin-5-like [Paramacrobiotus metropolitanus]|uniref:importin-5-like n=1 Tax=Paramacrobiotus metropolitanus TaxID=2943436 RepID=UPI002445E9A7|nr:importin-5-like [Paramacrobiotus metropolitanus]